MLEDVIKYVNDAFDLGANKGYNLHFERTVYWLLQLKPDADEAMQIAAYSHDVQRAFRTTDVVETYKDKEFDDPEHIREHQMIGAALISDFLKKKNYDTKLIIRINRMVLNHEVGGDEESDLIKDADSISFLEVNALKIVSKYSDSMGKQKIRNKFDWMYNRITSEHAKELARPMYDKALDALNAA